MATASEAPASITAEGPTQHVPNQAEALAKLREPFAPEQISKLPKVTCGACRDAKFKVCERHERRKCEDCNGSLTSAHIHLDYVGHADVTIRLLEVDPLWTWEPLAFDADGLPKLDHNGGMWIRLTVAGHPRLGYGDAQGKKGPNAVKEVIGDALRNAAMRFGVATELWSKSDSAKAKADAKALSDAPSREERLEELYGLMNKRWGNLEGLRAVKGMVGQEDFHESRVHDEAGVLRPFAELLDEQILVLVGRRKADDFMKKVRAGWNSADLCRANLAEASEKNFTDHQVPAGPDKVPTRVEDLLTARIAELAGPPTGAAEKQDTLSVPDKAATSADKDKSVHVQRLMKQVADPNCWNSPLALSQIKGDAERHQVLDHEVQGPPPGCAWMSFRTLIDQRFAELKQAAEARNDGRETA